MTNLSYEKQAIINSVKWSLRLLVAMTSHNWARRVFSVDDIREEVSSEISFEQLFEAFVAFEAFKAAHTNSRALQAWLVGKYGLATSMKCLSFVRSAMCLLCGDQKHLFMKLFPNVDAQHIRLFEVLNSTSEGFCEISEGSRFILAPPTCKCLICPSCSLSAHHECNVVVYGFSGAREATKILTRCQSCRNIYTIVSMETEGMAGNCMQRPGIALRLVTFALLKDRCTSCSVHWCKYNILSLLYIFIACNYPLC